jgi:hypothetical protein
LQTFPPASLRDKWFSEGVICWPGRQEVASQRNDCFGGEDVFVGVGFEGVGGCVEAGPRRDEDGGFEGFGEDEGGDGGVSVGGGGEDAEDEVAAC